MMDNDFDNAVQKKLDEAMPLVGLYIAAATAVCTLAMAADAFNGLRRKKLWIPCNYASLNAASLTVLAVAMKLPMDLNTVMIKSETDMNAKFTSLLFMSTTVNTLMPSLGSMNNDNDVLAIITALAILVITIMGNLAIQIFELHRFLKRATLIESMMIPSVLMLVSLATLVSLALSVSAMKTSLGWAYEERKKQNNEEEVVLIGDDEKRHMVMMKCWVMAESSSPQFVIARSTVCTASSMISSFAIIALTLNCTLGGASTNAQPGKSSYGVYTKWIVNTQSLGVSVAVIVAMSRWYVVLTIYSNRFGRKEIKNVEAYWIQTLKDWRNSLAAAGFQIGPNTRFRKILLNVKWRVLTLCIGLQFCYVLVSKIIFFLSAFVVGPFLSCFEKLVRQQHASSTYLDLNRSVLLLEGEVELPPWLVKSMCVEADRMIEIGRKKKPSSLIDLLHKSVNFKGAGQCSSSQIPTLLSQDPAYYWTLPIVTLTAIAVAIPNVPHHQLKQLLSSVSQGLSLAKLVEKASDLNANVRNVASVTWVQVLLYSKWLEVDLRREFLSCKNSKQVLQELSEKSQRIVTESESEARVSIVGCPQNWPVRAVAATSMYRVCETILLSSHGVGDVENGEEMVDRLSVVIADILAACLANLPHVITKMCQQNSIESVHEAFVLLGKTEQVVQLVQQQQQPIITEKHI